MRFYNSTQKNMSFSDVIASIKYFIKLNPDNKFILTVGTDSQDNGRDICFTAGINLHRPGQGAWCCVGKRKECNKHCTFNERIERETQMTFKIISMMHEHLIDGLCGFASEYPNFGFELEARMDMGERGDTRKLIREMERHFESSGNEEYAEGCGRKTVAG